MNPFEKLPDEVLYSMCETWDNTSLSRMVRTYGRIYQVCNKILENRHLEEVKKQDEEAQRILSLTGLETYVNFYKIVNVNGYNLLNIIALQKLPDNKLEIVQDISNPMLSKEDPDLFLSLAKQVPRILVDSKVRENIFAHIYIPYSRVKYLFRSYIIPLDDLESLRNLVKFMKGYQLVQGLVVQLKYNAQTYQ